MASDEEQVQVNKRPDALAGLHKKKVIYEPVELLALEYAAITPVDGLLPPVDFFRLNQSSDVIKMVNYMHNLTNPNFRAKYKLGAPNRGNRSNRFIPGPATFIEEDDNDPEWMDETNFKVDQDFQKYMRSGIHTTDEFEREKLTFQAMYKERFGKKKKKANSEDKSENSEEDNNKATSTLPADQPAESSGLENAKEHDDLKDELRKQLEEPEILGPTEEEYFQALQKQQAEEKEKELEQTKKSSITSSDYQFAVELDSRKEIDNLFMNSLLQKGQENSDKPASSSTMNFDHNERISLGRTGSQILPPQLNPANSSAASTTPGPNISNMASNGGMNNPNAQNTIDIQQLQIQQLRQQQFLQMQNMQNAQQIQQMKNMQQTQDQLLRNQQQNFQQQQPLQQQQQQKKPSHPQQQQPQQPQQPQQQQQQQQLQSQQLQLQPNIQAALAGILPPGVSLDSLPPQVLQMLISKINNSSNVNPLGSRPTSNNEEQIQQPPMQSQNPRPMSQGNGFIPSAIPQGFPPGVHQNQLQGLPQQILPPSGMPNQFMQGQQQISPPGLPQQFPPGMFPNANSPNPNLMNFNQQQRNLMGQGPQMNPVINGMPPSFPPGMAPPGAFPPAGAPGMQPSNMIPGNLPPPDQLPPPFREKFLNIQRMLMHFQQIGQPPPPPLVQDMIQFQQILQAKFGNPMNSRNNMGHEGAAHGASVISSTTATVATNSPRM